MAQRTSRCGGGFPERAVRASDRVHRRVARRGVDRRCVLQEDRLHGLLLDVLVENGRRVVHLVLLEPFSDFGDLLVLHFVLLAAGDLYWHFDSAVDVAAIRAKGGGVTRGVSLSI